MVSEVRRPRTREVVPRTEYPNFRDHGEMVDSWLLNVIASNQRKYGESFASEAGLRWMICQDSGHMPGVDTIPTALERLEARGLLTQEWLKAGGIKPDGNECTRGTRLVRLARNRHERFAFAARAARRNRRQGTTRIVDHVKLRTFDAARSAIARDVSVPPDAREAEAARKRQADLARLAELDAEWASPPRERPPD